MDEAIVGVYGASTLSQCFEINAEKHGIRLRGYIGNQNFYKPNKSYQSLFINGRFVQNATVSSAISNAYSSYLMKRQYPFYVLYLDVPAEIVDVNVHPNKSDVRFADNGIIYGCVYSIISAVLDGNTKALDYIVKQPAFSVYEEAGEVPEKKANLPTKPTTTLTEEILKKSQESTKEESMFGDFALSYADAQRELESCSPAFVAKKQGLSLPFEDTPKPQERVKGFIPMDEIGDYVPSEKARPLRKTKKTAEDLQKAFPDLFFERNVLRVEDPAFSESRKQEAEIDPFLANKQFLEELDKKREQNRIDVSSCLYAGKLFNTYLLYECKDDVYIIDQHAAHERLNFDRLKKQMNERAVITQPMLVPYQLSLNVFEREFIEEHLEDIREMGFGIEEAGENAFDITAVPLDLQNIDLERFFNDILSDISGYRSIRLSDILKDKLASAACKASVKGGMDLTREEIDALFAQMDGDMGLKCPHGRPVVVKMSRTELEKMFKRIV